MLLPRSSLIADYRRDLRRCAASGVNPTGSYATSAAGTRLDGRRGLPAICRQVDVTTVIPGSSPEDGKEISCRTIDDLTTKAWKQARITEVGCRRAPRLGGAAKASNDSLRSVSLCFPLLPSLSFRVARPRRERDASLPEVL